MNKIISMIAISFLLTGCGDNPFNDNEPIQDKDYALIRIEIQRCAHVEKEGSFMASMRWSPSASCLKHLKSRIVNTGKAQLIN